MDRCVLLQHAARRKHSAQHASCTGPVEVRRHALQVSRAGQQDAGLLRQTWRQRFGKFVPCRVNRAARGEWPQDAKQQAIDVLMRDGRNHVRVVQARAELALECRDFAGQLRELLRDRHRFAGAARRKDDERCEIVGRHAPSFLPVVVEDCRDRPAIGGKRAPERIDPAGQRGAIGRQRIGHHPHGLVRKPGADQRRGKFKAVLVIQRHARGIAARTERRPCAHAPQEHAVRNGRAIAPAGDSVFATHCDQRKQVTHGANV